MQFDSHHTSGVRVLFYSKMLPRSYWLYVRSVWFKAILNPFAFIHPAPLYQNRLHLLSNFSIAAENMLGKKIHHPTNQAESFSMCLTVFAVVFIFQSIPEIPPKPGELQTELRGYKAREEAAAALSQLKAEQKVDWWGFVHPLCDGHSTKQTMSSFCQQLEAATCLRVKSFVGHRQMDVFFWLDKVKWNKMLRCRRRDKDPIWNKIILFIQPFVSVCC